MSAPEHVTQKVPFAGQPNEQPQHVADSRQPPQHLSAHDQWLSSTASDKTSPSIVKGHYHRPESLTALVASPANVDSMLESALSQITKPSPDYQTALPTPFLFVEGKRTTLSGMVDLARTERDDVQERQSRRSEEKKMKMEVAEQKRQAMASLMRG